MFVFFAFLISFSPSKLESLRESHMQDLQRQTALLNEAHEQSLQRCRAEAKEELTTAVAFLCFSLSLSHLSDPLATVGKASIAASQ